MAFDFDEKLIQRFAQIIMLYLASEDFLCLHFTVNQLRDMIWKAEEYMAVKIVILILSIFVYFANVLLFLL